MIRINLLPPEYAQAQSKKEVQILSGSVGAFLVIVLMGFWYIRSKTASNLQQEITEKEADLRKYQSIVSQIETIEQNKRQLLAKRDVIRNLNRSRLIYPVFFEDLLPIVPSDVWVKQVDIQEQGANMKVVMASQALSNFALATWLTNLQQSTHFSNIVLSPIAYSNSDQSSQVLSFNITCTYQHQGPFPLSEFN